MIPDEELRTHRGMVILELTQKNIYNRDALEFIQDIALQVAKQFIIYEQFKSLLYYISQESESKNFKKFYSNLAEALPNFREDIVTLAYQLKQEGLQQGLEPRPSRGFSVCKKFIKTECSLGNY